MTRQEAARLAVTVIGAAAAGWALAAIWIFEQRSRPYQRPPHRLLDGTIADP